MCPAAPIWQYAGMRLALVAVAVAACSKPKLELAYEPTCEADPERFLESTRERVTEKGADVDVFVRGRRVIVAMPKDTPRDIVADLSALVVRYARLEVKIVDARSHYMSELYQHVQRDPQATIAAARDGVDDYVHAADPKQIDAYLAQLAARDPFFVLPADRQLAYGRLDREWRTYYLLPKVELDGTAIDGAFGSYDASTDDPIVVIEMTPAGARQMIDLTSRTVGGRLAVLLDGKVKTQLPIISAPPDGDRFRFRIDGPDLATRERLRDELVAVLRVGSVPCPLRAFDR